MHQDAPADNVVQLVQQLIKLHQLHLRPRRESEENLDDLRAMFNAGDGGGL